MKNDHTVVDLFAGCGGLSLGFENAGFKVRCAIEIDEWASETYSKNREEANIICKDIYNLSDSFFKKYSGTDVVMGGPPCQGFSIAASNRRKPDDSRNYMYREFLRAVKIIDPKLVLIENVKELAKFRLPNNKYILDDICDTLKNMGYCSRHYLFNAVNFGVPQNRTRFFLVASKDTISPILNFSGSTPITLWEAISDLPEVEPRKYKEGDIFEYSAKPLNSYQKLMRDKSDLIYNHIPMRHTDAIIERFKHISLNGKEQMPEKFLPRRRSNIELTNSKIYSQNHRRLNPNMPSPTITASFYSSFIHPYQPRNLTVREAARLQSFPDKYQFFGKRTTLSKKLLARKGIKEDIHLDQFNQVGNAVPPLLAQRIAKSLINMLAIYD